MRKAEPQMFRDQHGRREEGGGMSLLPGRGAILIGGTCKPRLLSTDSYQGLGRAPRD